MLDLLPVLIKRSIDMEVRAVIKIVARYAKLRLCLFKRNHHFADQLESLLLGNIDIAIFGSDMHRTGAVTVFTAVTVQQLVIQFQVASFVGKVLLWIPTRYMAAQTLRVVMTLDPHTLSRIGQVSSCSKVGPAFPVDTVLPDIVGGVMAVVASFRANVLSAGRVSNRFNFQSFQTK